MGMKELDKEEVERAQYGHGMDNDTLNALVLSIDKWKAIVDGTGVDTGTDNCELCKKFYDKDDDDFDTCAGCPVREEVHDSCCNNTPYTEWNCHQTVKHKRLKFPFKIEWADGCDECMKLAKAELEFLESLLPEKESEV